MTRSFTIALLGALAARAWAADTAPTCNPSNKCPDSLPCCSQYGACGVGAYCLGGCDPLSSNSLDSCVPAPVCKSQQYSLSSLDGITPKTKYLGDASKTDWVADGTPQPYDGAVLLTMAPDTVGTLLASSTYMWYGKVSAKLKTSRGQGVVTAFILLSDVKDEIDYEFVGTELDIAQSNFYFQGVTNYNNGKNISGIPNFDTFSDYHEYEIDWTPSQITWSIDGKPYRTLKQKDTYNSTAKQYYYPQTPARVQLSLWPAGLSTNGKGTIEWAGGLIDWNSEDIKNNGYYYAGVKEVNMQCYDAPSGAKSSGSKSYVYTANGGTQDTVEITDKPTVLKSLLGSGTNMSADFPSASATKGKGSKTGSSSSATSGSSLDNSVPGLSGAGPGAEGPARNGDGSSVPGGSQSGSSSGSDTSSASGSSTTGFSQGGTSAGDKKGNSAPGQPEKVLQGSFAAFLIALGGMLLL